MTLFRPKISKNHVFTFLPNFLPGIFQAKKLGKIDQKLAYSTSPNWPVLRANLGWCCRLVFHDLIPKTGQKHNFNVKIGVFTG